jgi:hypothetical protein
MNGCPGCPGCTGACEMRSLMRKLRKAVARLDAQRPIRACKKRSLMRSLRKVIARLEMRSLFEATLSKLVARLELDRPIRHRDLTPDTILVAPDANLVRAGDTWEPIDLDPTPPSPPPRKAPPKPTPKPKPSRRHGRWARLHLRALSSWPVWPLTLPPHFPLQADQTHWDG